MSYILQNKKGKVTIISSSLDGFEIKWLIDESDVTGYDDGYSYIKTIGSEFVSLWGCRYWGFNLEGKRNSSNEIKVILTFQPDNDFWEEKAKTKSYLKATFMPHLAQGEYNDYKTFKGKERETPEGGFEVFSLTDHEISNDFSMEFKLSIETSEIMLPNPAKRFKSLSEDFGKMLEDTKGHDLTIKCNGVKMTAHKNILSSRCSVFAAMFEVDMREARESEIEMNETSPESVGAMLHWIYTCHLKEKDEEFALDLIKLAHMYEMRLLMEECGPILISQIKKENVIDILVASDLVGAKDVKENAISFIIRDQSIIKMDEFLTKVSKELMREIILAGLNRGPRYIYDDDRPVTEYCDSD